MARHNYYGYSDYGAFTIGSFHTISLLDICCANPGNPVFTCDKRTVEKAQLNTFDPKGIDHIYYCINSKYLFVIERKETFYCHQHPMYSTTSGVYG